MSSHLNYAHNVIRIPKFTKHLTGKLIAIMTDEGEKFIPEIKVSVRPPRSERRHRIKPLVPMGHEDMPPKWIARWVAPHVPRGVVFRTPVTAHQARMDRQEIAAQYRRAGVLN